MTGGLAATNEGAAGAGLTVMVRGGLFTALVALLAEMAKVAVPAVVGVPDSNPPLDSDSPAGSAPEATAKVGAG